MATRSKRKISGPRRTNNLSVDRSYYEYERVSDGTLLRRCQVNEHHLEWPDKGYNSKTQKDYRKMPGMLLYLCIQNHSELHANLKQPPPRPEHGLMTMAMEFNEALPVGSRYDSFYRMIDFFKGVSDKSQQASRAEQARRIASHFTAQSPYVRAGMVRVLDPLDERRFRPPVQGAFSKVGSKVASMTP